jgi:hypothetical protein
MTLDSNKPYTVVTKFFSNKGQLDRIERSYEQNGQMLYGFEQSDYSAALWHSKFSENNDFGRLGGMKVMGESMQKGWVLVMSIW